MYRRRPGGCVRLLPGLRPSIQLLESTPDGMTQSEVSRAFSCHKSAAELKRALGLLEGKGKVWAEKELTTGLPITRWRLVAESAP